MQEIEMVEAATLGLTAVNTVLIFILGIMVINK
jgi:hypothetical protein